MTSTTPPDSDLWARSLLNAVRRWFFLPFALGLIGAVLGGSAGMAAQPSSESLLGVQSTETDGAGLQRLVESAVQELNTTEIYATAAKASGVDADSLRQRTRIAAVPDSQILSVTVTAPTAGQAAAESRAISDAGVQASQDRTKAELKRLTDATLKLMSDPASRATDDRAERARVARLGDELAANQSALVRGSNQLTLLQSGEATSTVASPLLLAGMGLVGGVLLGLALALLLGARRGKIQSTRELHQLYPQFPVLNLAEVPSVISIEAGAISTVIVAGVQRSPEKLQVVTDAVRDGLRLAGREVQLVNEHQSAVLTPMRLNGSARYARDSTTQDVSVLSTSLNSAVVRRVRRDPGTLLLITVEPRNTRWKWLGGYLSDLDERTYLLVQRESSKWTG